MLIYLDQAFTEMVNKRREENRRLTERDLYAAIMEGAVERVRPNTKSLRS
jgi:Cu(I)/Ag(I) efflux system membrane protein CusA/SilA